MQHRMSNPWNLCTTAIALGAALLSTGCFSANNSYMRAINASPGLNNFSVIAGVIGVAANLPYGTEGVEQEGQYSGPADSSGDYRPVGAGPSQPILVAQGAKSTTIAQASQTLVKNDVYTIVVVGSSANPSLVVATDNDLAPQGGDFKWRLINTSSAAGPVDIYLTALGASLNGQTPVVSNLQYGQVSAYFQLAPGSDEIQVTQHGNTATALQTATFAPTGGTIHTTVFLDPPSSTTTTYGILTTSDPVGTVGVPPPGSK